MNPLQTVPAASPLTLVLGGVLVFTLLALFLDSRGLIPERIRVQGPLVTVHTKRGQAVLDRLAAPRRFWRAWSNVGVGIALVVMVGSFLFLAWQGLSILRNPPAPTSVNQPRNFLVIPGVNDFLPLSVAPEIVLGLLIGLVVHEGGHGLLCRVERIDIESMGLVLLTLLPIGAFVEPDEESQRGASRGARTRMFAAGVTNNFALAVVAFALLFGPVVGAIAVAPGVAVNGAYDQSPAANAGIDGGDRIVSVAGTAVGNVSELDAALANAEDRSVSVEVAEGSGETRSVTVNRSLVVFGTIGGNPANLSVQPDEGPIRVLAVNGTEVRTLSEFREAVADRPVAEIRTSEGVTTLPVGAYVTDLRDDGPLAAAGAPNDTAFVVTRVGGERTVTQSNLRDALRGLEPGQNVSVVGYVDGDRQVWNVTVGEDRTLGIADTFRGTSGLVLDDFGVREYPAGTYLELLGGDGGPGSSFPLGVADGFLWLVIVSLALPLASVIFGLPENFPGFTGEMTNFYEVTGPLGTFGDAPVFVLANVLFWTAWINLQLGLFNCIPGYPLDGGRILRMVAEAVVSRLPVSDRHALVRTITTSIGLTMLVSLLLLLFGPQLLGG
jgi:membrane-associated protease RseP (regulator of RpoE activity)